MTEWNKTLFTDETAFQLFRNTVERKRSVRRMPKDRTKIMAWSGVSAKGKTSLFCFKQIMNADFYVGILRTHAPEISQMLGNRWRTMILNTLAVLLRPFLKKISQKSWSG